MPGLYKGLRNLGLAEQKEMLLAQLNSDQHYRATPTLAYGNHDPFEVRLAACDTCTHKPLLTEVSLERSRTRWQVVCPGCSKLGGEPTRNPWTASLMWNGINLQSQRYTDLPLFGLTDLNPRQAHERIKLIRANLVLRISLCEVERHLFKSGAGNRKPGANFTLKLDAYLKWAMLAHRLIKIAKLKKPTRVPDAGQMGNRPCFSENSEE